METFVNRRCSITLKHGPTYQGILRKGEHPEAFYIETEHATKDGSKLYQVHFLRAYAFAF